ncbi:hypothetical protein [Planotetraspora silvatica]|uniref:hypothetical protein n=1 Tax=Planotetraspora silvatica TaxID=234614 RepID=UPI001951FD28|nr:hypothetical protein [Planotetraspora silvatica]
MRIRTYKGRLVKTKDPEGQKLIAERITRIDLDVLAVQEVETSIRSASSSPNTSIACTRIWLSLKATTPD